MRVTKVGRIIVAPLCVALVIMTLVTTGGIAQKTVTLTYWCFAAIERDAYKNLRAAEYETLHPNIKIKLETVPWKDYIEKLLVAASSKTGPNIYDRSNDYFQTFIEAGFALDLSPWISEKLLDTYIPSCRQSMVRKDKVFGVGKEMDPIAVHYRKDMFDEAQIPYPSDDWTWNDFLQIAKKLTKDVDGDGRTDIYGASIPTDPGSYTVFISYPFLWSAGGEVVNQDWSESLLDRPEAAQALQFWGDLINRHKVVSPKPFLRDEYPLINKMVAMHVVGPWMLSDYYKMAPEMDYGIAPVPKGPVTQKTVYGGWFTIVNPYAENHEESAKFVIWLFGDPLHDLEWCNMVPAVVPRKRFLESQTFVALEPEFSIVPEVAKKFQEYRDACLEPGYLRAEPAYTVEMVEAYSDAIEEIVFKNAPASKSLKKAAERINKFLNQTTIKYPPGQ